MDRSQFTFYFSFYQAIRRIRKKADRADAYDAICSYALTGVLPDSDSLPDSVAIVFDLIRPNLDTSRRKSAGGKRGSKPKDDDKIPSGCEEDKGKEKKKEKEKEKEREIENECLKEKEKFSSVSKSPPTVSEVQAYCTERGNTVDPEKFVDFYTAKGWRVGKTPMRDWKAAVRTWEKHDDKKNSAYRFDPGSEEDYL